MTRSPGPYRPSALAASRRTGRPRAPSITVLARPHPQFAPCGVPPQFGTSAQRPHATLAAGQRLPGRTPPIHAS
eukprot:10760749-Heterocapsa_arctica.AAC.1